MSTKNAIYPFGIRTPDLPVLSAVSLLKAVNNLYMAVNDYGYDYMHIAYGLYRAF
jgi:hypothetical protein